MPSSPATASSSNQPRLNWLELLGGSADDTGFVVASGPDGAIYLGGETNGGAWDGASPRGRRDGFVARFNLAGQRLWTQWYGSSLDDQVRGLGVDPSGALYVSGGALDGVEGNPGLSPGASDGFLSRISIDGRKQWTTQLGAESWDLLRSLATGPGDGAVYGIGYSASRSFSKLMPKPQNEEGPDAFLIKADASGHVLWASRIGSGKQDYGMNLALGIDGFVYATGFSGNSTADSPADAFLSKLNARDGSLVWTRFLGTSVNDYGEDLCIDKDGFIYVLISTDGNLAGQPYQGNRDVGVQKFDRDGKLIWTVVLGTPQKEEGRNLICGPDGSLYLTGLTAGDLGGQKNSGGEDAFVCRISPDGVIAWTRLFGTAADDVGWALSLAANNSLIVSGLTNGNLEGRSSRGGQDAFIASLDLSEPLAPASVSVSLTGAQAREQGGPPLIYNVTRTGSLQDPLTIYYRLARTASQADYNGATASALNNLRLPAGVRSAELVLTPVADAQREGDESILLSLDPGPGYTIATPQTLQATILGDGNHLPIATAQVRLSLRVGGPTLSGRLTAADPDPGDRSAFTLLSAAPAGFALDESGAWSFNPADPQHLTLPAGQRRSTTLFYRVEDRVSQIQPPLPAGVIRVGGADGQFSTIQAALDQAPAGSVIVVAAGSYSENLIIRKPVTLLGAFQGIAAQDPARGKAGKETEIRGYVTVSASATDVTIDGVTLIGDPDRGVNMRVQAESSRLLNSIITAVRPAGGYADFAFVRFARDPGSPSGLSSVVAANNVFNGNVDYSSTPVVLQINRSASVRVQANSFLNCGGGGNIVLADDSGDISVSDNLLIGGGKGIATYNGTFARLTIENNTILDSNLTGIDINENSVIQAGGIEGNRVSGSGINRTQRTDVSPANLSVSELATLWDGFRIGDNDLSQTFAQIPAYQGFVPTGSTTATNRPSSIGALTIDLQAPVPTAASPAIPLARASDAARFRISRFASGLGFPSSMAELEDGSLLTAVTLGDPANRSPFGSTPSQLLRLVDANRDGSSDTVQVLATLPGFVTSLRRVGDLIFALSSGRQGTSPSISIFRTGATASAPLREVGVLQFQFPPDYLTAVNAHTSYALAARASATLPDGLELFFNLGPLEEDRSTDPSLTIGLAAFGDLALAPARMAPDSIQRLLISDRGDRLLISPPETVASGVRNAAGISFDRAGNLIFEDNGFSKPANGENTFSADELNRVNGDEIGRSVPDFGFGESFVRYSDGVIVNPSPDYRPPLVSFLPLAGRKSEGAVEVSMAPSGFPTEFINTVLTSFFGRFGVGTSLNDENPIVAADPESGTYYHFIGSGLLGNPGGLLAAGGSLYVADFSSTGLFFGSNGNTPADQAGAIYQISPIQPASFLSLPTLLDADASSATLTWTTDSDAFSTLELWGGPILEQAPRLYTLTPQRTGSQFSSRISLRDLLPGTVYSYRVRLGDQTSQASFSTAAAPLPRIELSLQRTAVREDGPAGLLYAVTRSGDSSAPLEVRVLLGGTANPSSDYDLAGAFNLAGSGASLRFAAGSSRATLLVDPRPDQQPEADETVAVSLAAGEGYAIASAAPVVGTILNDDSRVALSLADPSVAEDSGAPLRWTVSRSGDLSVPLTVRFRVTGSATPASGGADGDYSFSGPVSLRDGIGSLSLAAGVASAGFSLTPSADSTVEEDETISLRLLPTGYALAYGGPLTATIRNDDVPKPPNAIPLARSLDQARFSVTRFASGLTFPTSLTALEDQSILVADNSNGTGTLLRLVDQDNDGISDQQTILASMPGLIATVRRLGNLVVTISPFQAGNRAVITLWRTGQTSGDPAKDSLKLAGRINLDYPSGFLHRTTGLALRNDPRQSGAIELFFNVGSQRDGVATDPSLRVAIQADSGASMSTGFMNPDSIQKVTLRDLGDRLEVSAPTIIARGVRNAAGMTFDSAGNLLFEDNGIDDDPSGKSPAGDQEFSADELNRIFADEIGNVVPDFGFASNYTLSSNGAVVNASPSFRAPIAAFLPLNGGRSEGAVELAMAPVGFPGEWLNTAFINFFGIGNDARNIENAFVAADSVSGSYFHFINADVLGMGTGVLASQNALYLSDRSLRLGSGSVYRITPRDPSRLLAMPQLQTGHGIPQLRWSTTSDAITSLEIWGGSLSQANPRLTIHRPEATTTPGQFLVSAPLQQLEAPGTYSYTVRVGQQSQSGSFTLPPPLPIGTDFDWASATPLAGIQAILRASLNLASPRAGEPSLAVTALRVDLKDPHIRLTGSGRAPGWSDNGTETLSQTARQFISGGRAAGQPLVAAINAAPFDLNPLLQFQSVASNLRGFVVSEGQLVSGPDANTDTFKSTFLVDRVSGARIENIGAANAPAAAALQVAVSGFGIVLSNGVAQGDTVLQNARSALGLSADRRWLTLLTVDRRTDPSRPGSWLGATDRDVGTILQGFGATDGMLLDGGTSSQMAWWNPATSRPELLNAPLVERFVGSSLGVVVAAPVA